MIRWNDFVSVVHTSLDRDISKRKDPDQHRAIRSPSRQSLFIVAGPGSGKTTVISLRVLKLILVDGFDPSCILVTTFTNKAADELRSRILGWGDRLRQAFLGSSSYFDLQQQLHTLNLNRVVTGTLDSISEEILTAFRAPGASPPVVIEDFASNALIIRGGLFARGRHNSGPLRDYVADLRGTRWGLNVSEISASLREIRERFVQDQIDSSQYRAAGRHPGFQVACDAIDDYTSELESRGLSDFVRLEQDFLGQLRSGTLGRFLKQIRFVLVDEYQDTNLLQEQIYFELARATQQNEGSITVVGDDDQSLYRFRGATVDLFQSFPRRIKRQLGIDPFVIHLSRNYRSTKRIVDFCNRFIGLDQDFQNARVVGKPSIAPARRGRFTNYPLLGMFRRDVSILARDLAQFIYQTIHGRGFSLHVQANHYSIRINPRGSPADVALLCSSPQELDPQGSPRLPFLLRRELSRFTVPIRIFNPRGQRLPEIRDVQVLCGLVLECIDPDSVVQNTIRNLPQDARVVLDTWRTTAMNFIRNNPGLGSRYTLRQFVNAWKRRTALGVRRPSREVPLVDLIYKLVTWIPSMQNDIEGIVYLEAITRTVTQSALLSEFGSQIIFDQNDPDSIGSVKEVLWDVLVPIATGAIEVNEDLLETLPSDRINVMSIHQAKGLEFPLVVVDVGSDFRTDHHAHAFKRFPRKGAKPHNMEDEFRRYSQMGRPSRKPLDRAFDDLVRQYFVAYSRAQDVLLFAGLDSVREHIPNIATGWDRRGNWRFRQGLRNLTHI